MSIALGDDCKKRKNVKFQQYTIKTVNGFIINTLIQDTIANDSQLSQKRKGVSVYINLIDAMSILSYKL